MAEQSSAVTGAAEIAVQSSLVVGAAEIAVQSSSAVVGAAEIAVQSSLVTGGGGILVQDSTVLGGGGITEHVTAVLGGGGMADPDSIPLCCVGPARQARANVAPAPVGSGEVRELEPRSVRSKMSFKCLCGRGAGGAGRRCRRRTAEPSPGTPPRARAGSPTAPRARWP